MDDEKNNGLEEFLKPCKIFVTMLSSIYPGMKSFHRFVKTTTKSKTANIGDDESKLSFMDYFSTTGSVLKSFMRMAFSDMPMQLGAVGVISVTVGIFNHFFWFFLLPLRLGYVP